MNTSSLRQRKGGFSLIEILVVLGIAAFVGSMVLGGFSSFQGSQRRSTCSSNLVQIYRACRLYANDNDYYPPLGTHTTEGRVGGLALLWGRVEPSGNGPIVRPPIDSSTSYLKSPEALHCPADVDVPATSSVSAVKEDATLGVVVDPKYLSYQKLDTVSGDYSYSDVRVKITAGNPVTSDFARQLRHRNVVTTPYNKEIEVNVPTPSSTVITWCPFHRGLSARPDNVLFYDGSVRRMEIVQSAECLPGRPISKGWLRLADCAPVTSTTPAPSNEGAALAQ